jgi:hypothetical protein
VGPLPTPSKPTQSNLTRKRKLLENGMQFGKVDIPQQALKVDC